MPVDRYRNVGPEDSEDYHLFQAPNLKNYKEKLNDLLAGGKRTDGRKWDELRKIYLKTGVVSSVKGSAYIEVGQSKVLVSVYEPKEIPRLAEFRSSGELQVEFKYAPFSGIARRPLGVQADEKDIGYIIKRALEPAVCRTEFPNCQVEIYVLVLDDDGGTLSAAVTAAGVALADAGIPMYDTVAAVSMVIQNDRSFVDPIQEEEAFCQTTYPETLQAGHITIAYLPTLGQISTNIMEGCLFPERLIDNLDLLIERCCSIADLSKLTLARDVLKKRNEELEAKSTDGESV